MREYCKKKLDREIEKGYNINVSSYAIGTLDATEYDETYTEYRVQKWIEGGNNAMRLIKTEEEKNLEKIYAPYYDYTKTPALSPDAPDEAVKAYQKQQELFKRKYAEAEALFFSNGDN